MAWPSPHSPVALPKYRVWREAREVLKTLGRKSLGYVAFQLKRRRCRERAFGGLGCSRRSVDIDDHCAAIAHGSNVLGAILYLVFHDPCLLATTSKEQACCQFGSSHYKPSGPPVREIGIRL